jgi:hypothetical protein
MRRLWVWVLVLISGAAAAQAQQPVVRRTGHGTRSLDARLERILADPAYLVLTRDTTVARGDTLAGPILSMANRLVIEGTIIGDLVVVDANVYLRPSARIVGGVLNIGGGLYRSEQATITGSYDDQPLAPYHVERDGNAFIIGGDVEEKIVTFKPAFPVANRVDGIRPSFGAQLAFPVSRTAHIELEGWGGFAFERDGGFEEQAQGGAELRWRREVVYVGAGIDRNTATNDTWIRSDLKNTLSMLWEGKDYRNYYDAKRVYAFVGRDLVRGGHEALIRLNLQREHASSLFTGDPWALFPPDEFRFNPPIDDGVSTSAILGLSGTWSGATTAAVYDGAVEVAADGPLGGEFNFMTYRVWGEWAMQALANHTIEIETRFQGPLPGTDSLPRQRWGMLGGSGTLYTFGVGEFIGDRVVFVESKYMIPLPIRLPILRSPHLDFIYATGMAWSNRTDPTFEQNVGVRLQFPFVYVRAIINPADTNDYKFSFGVSTPRKLYPWERRSEQ